MTLNQRFPLKNSGPSCTLKMKVALRVGRQPAREVNGLTDGLTRWSSHLSLCVISGDVFEYGCVPDLRPPPVLSAGPQTQTQPLQCQPTALRLLRLPQASRRHLRLPPLCISVCPGRAEPAEGRRPLKISGLGWRGGQPVREREEHLQPGHLWFSAVPRWRQGTHTKHRVGHLQPLRRSGAAAETPAAAEVTAHKSTYQAASDP